MNRRQFFQGIGGAALSQAVAAGQRGQRERLPNVVLIYADDVGYGDIGCYGATRVRTPNLDRLAGGGLRFTNAHSSSATCTPARYSLMTGQYAWRRKDTGILPGDAPLLIRPGQTTLPATLRQAGYHTAAVGKWHLGLGNGNIDWNGDVQPGPNEIGFNYSFIIPATGDRVPCVFVENHRVVNLDPKDPIRVDYRSPLPGEVTAREHPELLRMKSSHGHDQALVNGVGRIGYMTGGKSALWVDEDISGTLTKKAVAFIEREKANPFFLYFATHDIHVPRMPNRRFVGATGMGPRGDAIAELDWSVGQVLAALDRNGLTRDTLVMFSSDNGPVVDDGYRDEAVEKLGDHKPAGIYRGGKYSIFDGGTRVPWIVRWPRRVKADTVSDAMISQVDLTASLAALCGRKLPEDAAPDSFDEIKAILGESKTGRPYVVEQARSLAVIEDGFKYIEPNNGPKYQRTTNTELGNDPEPQLYKVRDDPSERNNLAASEPERVVRLKTLLDKVKATARSRP